MIKPKEFLLNLRYAFRPGKPLLTLRLAKTLFASVILRKPPLRYVDFALDFGCNLKCDHCFATSLRREGLRKLSIGEYRDIADQCMKLGTVNFSFQGGEPLLFDNLYEIIKAFRPERNLISVTTNGTLLNDARVKELKVAGVDILTVSLDSSKAEEHDAFRGVPGSFEKTVNGIRLALKEGLRVTLGCVVTHGNLRSEGISGLIRMAEEMKVVLYIILPVPAGRWARKDDILLTEDDLAYIDGIVGKYRYLRTDFQANLGGYGCGAIKEILYITPYGDVLPCPFIHISIGNVMEEPIASIRERGLGNRYFKAYHNRCLASTDAEFIKTYLSRTFHSPKLPLKWDEAFGCKGRQ